MTKPRVDLDRWPVVRVTWPEVVTIDDIDAHFTEMRPLWSRRSHFAVVVDTRAGKVLPADQRKRAAEQMHALAAQGPDLLIGVAYIVSSNIARGVLTALHWLYPPPFPVTVVTSEKAALEWAESRLASATSRPSS